MLVIQKAAESCSESTSVFLVLWLLQTALSVWILYRWRRTLQSWGRAIDQNERLCVLLGEQQTLLQAVLTRAAQEHKAEPH